MSCASAPSIKWDTDFCRILPDFDNPVHSNFCGIFDKKPCADVGVTVSSDQVKSTGDHKLSHGDQLFSSWGWITANAPISSCKKWSIIVKNASRLKYACLHFGVGIDLKSDDFKIQNTFKTWRDPQREHSFALDRPGFFHSRGNIQTYDKTKVLSDKQRALWFKGDTTTIDCVIQSNRTGQQMWRISVNGQEELQIELSVEALAYGFPCAMFDLNQPMEFAIKASPAANSTKRRAKPLTVHWQFADNATKTLHTEFGQGSFEMKTDSIVTGSDLQKELLQNCPHLLHSKTKSFMQGGFLPVLCSSFKDIEHNCWKPKSTCREWHTDLEVGVEETVIHIRLYNCDKSFGKWKCMSCKQHKGDEEALSLLLASSATNRSFG
jgi:hypothetical protein